ncbi:IS3 family transposase [uncultured Cloacibacillus sp.]|uniref:IS3 family transposase n=1 Tax=uncultured Cloacibacillus sp. TaxID=889794 RepID=UPI0026DC3A26|nr:IS3 family transposase [uncultured Cloacibacillus sp.]
MTQKNKYRVIAEFTGKYSITVMCQFMSVPRSSYYYWLKNKDCDDKDAPLIESIREGHRVSRGTYGYRQMTIWLNRTYGINVNSKRVRRVMKKAGLQSVVRKKRI